MGRPKRQRAHKLVGKSKTARERKIAEIKANGGAVPLAMFEVGMTPEALQAHLEQKRSNAGVPHGNAKARRDKVGSQRRVGSRSDRKKAAIREAW